MNAWAFEPASGKQGFGPTLMFGVKMGQVWVGIDVSKQKLDVAFRPAGEVFSVNNDEAGIKR
jgi:hypothetical protein